METVLSKEKTRKEPVYLPFQLLEQGKRDIPAQKPRCQDEAPHSRQPQLQHQLQPQPQPDHPSIRYILAAPTLIPSQGLMVASSAREMLVEFMYDLGQYTL
jgi:hypothetical protein